MSVLIVIVIFIFLYFAADYYTSISGKEEKDQKVLEENNYIEENCVTISQEYDFSNSAYKYNYFNNGPIHIRFIVDTEDCNIMISSYDGLKEIVPFSDILGCEIISNNQVTGGVGRAVAGGLLAGGAGAVVGASTAKEQIMSYKVILYIKEIAHPKIELELIRKQIKKTDPDYKEAVEFAQNINATVKAIITYNS